MSFPGAGEEGGREWDGEGSEVGGLSVHSPRPPGPTCSGSLFIFNGGHWGRVWAGECLGLRPPQQVASLMGARE